MENETTGEGLSAPGTLLAGMAGGGELRWVAADITEPVKIVRRRLDMSPPAVAALGRSLAGAALLLRLSVKTPTRLLLEIRGDGPARQILAEADDEGNLRGFVREPRATAPARADGKLPVREIVGRGVLGVAREYPRGGRYRSQVELVSGEIGADVAHYLRQSEQTPSAVLLGVLVRPGGVAAAGGVVVEALPGASDRVLTRLEENVRFLGGVSRALEEGGLAAVQEALFAGLGAEARERRELRYHCRCSRERIERHLVVLSADELAPYREPDGTIRAECDFCGEAYEFRPGDLAPETEANFLSE